MFQPTKIVAHQPSITTDFAAFERNYNDRMSAIYAAPRRARPAMTQQLRSEMADLSLAPVVRISDTEVAA